MTEPSLIIGDSCIGCGQCVRVCIRGHLAIRNGKAAETESAYSCFGCGHCQAVCPKNAVVLRGFEDREQAPQGECPVSPSSLEMMYRTRRSLRWFDRNCTREELEVLLGTLKYSPTAENSQAVQFAVVDNRFYGFMEHIASILSTHTGEHPRLEQFVRYVEGGMKERNNPFTWEGRQLIIAF